MPQDNTDSFTQPLHVKLLTRSSKSIPLHIPQFSRPHSAHGLGHHRTFTGTLAAAGGDDTTAADPVAVVAVDALPVAADDAARAEYVGRRAGRVDGADERVGPGDARGRFNRNFQLELWLKKSLEFSIVA